MAASTRISKEDGEFRVKLFIDGVYQAGADYFTDDKKDANRTAMDMIVRGGISDKTTSFAKSEMQDHIN